MKHFCQAKWCGDGLAQIGGIADLPVHHNLHGTAITKAPPRPIFHPGIQSGMHNGEEGRNHDESCVYIVMIRTTYLSLNIWQIFIR